ncbi:type VI secretion protein [Xanthomonas sp. 4461]|uniref:Type VI secretion protein n=1 Tax=Xanthomonas sp. 10-10 TaxID=3115848 RepID=A0AAU7PC23_9XANT|nr:type VI secretion protein [Xanthomonas sp. 4461]
MPTCKSLGTLLMVCATSAAAQQVTTHACASVPDPLPRLACYDASFPPSPEVRAAEAGRGLREFGRNPAQASAMSPVKPPAQVSATVVTVTYRADGTRVVVLDTRQRWALTEATSRGHLAEGDAVTIRTAAMGSYMLVTPGGVALRARRLD